MIRRRQNKAKLVGAIVSLGAFGLLFSVEVLTFIDGVPPGVVRRLALMVASLLGLGAVVWIWLLMRRSKTQREFREIARRGSRVRCSRCGYLLRCVQPVVGRVHGLSLERVVCPECGHADLSDRPIAG